MATGSVVVYGSDGRQGISGRIEETFLAKQKAQQRKLISEGRQFYLAIQQGRAEGVRDYATALAEILPRITEGSLVVLQGKPLYRRDPIDWTLTDIERGG